MSNEEKCTSCEGSGKRNGAMCLFCCGTGVAGYYDDDDEDDWLVLLDWDLDDWEWDEDDGEDGFD